MLGYCKGFSSYYDRTSFVEGNGAIENVLLRQEEIKEKIEELIINRYCDEPGYEEFKIGGDQYEDYEEFDYNEDIELEYRTF